VIEPAGLGAADFGIAGPEAARPGAARPANYSAAEDHQGYFKNWLKKKNYSAI